MSSTRHVLSLSRINRKKMFYCACVFNFVVYWVIGVAWFFSLPTGFWYTGVSDFFMYMRKVEVFLANPDLLYAPSGDNPLYGLPATILYFIPFFLTPGSIGMQFLLASTTMIAWTVGVCILISKILDTEKIKAIQGKSFIKDKYSILTVFVLIPWQWIEYWIVSTDTIIIFFVLLGIYYYLKDKKNLSFFFWSFGAIFKPFPIYLFMFLFYEKKVTDFLKRLCFIVFAQIPNLIIFLIWPEILRSYIAQNTSPEYTYPQASGSITRDITALFSIPVFETTIIVFLVLAPIHMYFVLIQKKNALTVIDKAMVMFLLGIAIVPSFYNAHNLVFLGLYLLWLYTDNPNIDKKIKLIPIFPIVFMPIWTYYVYLSPFYFLPLVLVDFALLWKSVKKNSSLVQYTD